MQKNKGFTLIELLVVIAIIGILASVVLASLNSARAKGADAAVKSNLANMRAQAEIFYDTASTYTAVCDDTNMAAAQVAAVAAGGNGGSCTESATGDAWAAWAGLKSDEELAWCVDSTGASRQVSNETALGEISVCPAL